MKLPEFKSEAGQDFDPLNVHMELSKVAMQGILNNQSIILGFSSFLNAAKSFNVFASKNFVIISSLIF